MEQLLRDKLEQLQIQAERIAGLGAVLEDACRYSPSDNKAYANAHALLTSLLDAYNSELQVVIDLAYGKAVVA